MSVHRSCLSKHVPSCLVVENCTSAASGNVSRDKSIGGRTRKRIQRVKVVAVRVQLIIKTSAQAIILSSSRFSKGMAMLHYCYN